ncbi:MAG: hypothetical protein ACR2O2_08610, partial [Ruegeria sp.]
MKRFINITKLTLVLAFSAVLLAGWGLPLHAQEFLGGGFKSPVGTPENPLEVGVGIKIDQITSVDQKAENFGAVVVLRVEWSDPALTFDREEAGREIRVFNPTAFAEYASTIDTVLPAFVIHNQQSNRWIHESAIAQSYDGRVTYVEKSSLTLQAPHFNFLKYPFDTQEFHFEVVSIFPSEFVSYKPLPGYSGLGDLLGEEEWILQNARVEKSTVVGLSGRVSDQVELVFEGKRHLTYYVIRVFLPMLVLITVGWALFFLDEYRKR